MNEKEIANLIKSDDALKADDRLWESIEKKVQSVEDTSNIKLAGRTKNHIPFFRYGIASSCLAVILLILLILPNLNNPSVNSSNIPPAASSQNSINQGPVIVHGSSPALGTANGPAPGVSNGPVMFNYYRYDNKYYKAEYPAYGANDQISRDFADIQNKIVKKLSDSFYEISGIAPSKSIAHFDGRYYYKLDYVFEDSVALNNKPYLINANEIPDPITDSKTGKTTYTIGENLGKAGSFDAYALPGFDPSEKIALKFSDTDTYCIAYQLLSSVTLNGITYEVQPEIYPVQADDNAKYIGKAGPYSAYAINNVDPAQSIFIRTGDNHEATANAVIKPSDKNIPESWYGSPFESMYPIVSDIEWDHKIYQVSSYDYMGNQKTFCDQVGKQIGSYAFNSASNTGSITYYLYEINGKDSSRNIAVKNNEVFIEYDYLLDSIVKFDGRKYEISLSGDSGVRGDKIGVSGSNDVFEVKGVDPSKEIIVLINGTTWTAYSTK